MYLVIWLASIRFPTKYIYALPLVIVFINTITLCYWYLSLVNEEEQTATRPEMNFSFCSLAQMWDTLILVCFVAPSFEGVLMILVADAGLRVLHYQLFWKHVLDDPT